MQFTAILAALSLTGIYAQQFTNSSSSSVRTTPVISSTSSGVSGPTTFAPQSTPSGTVLVVKFSIPGRSGGFQCLGATGVFFNATITAAQGDQFNLAADGSFTCSVGGSITNVFVNVQVNAKRQVASPVYAIGLGAVPAGAFTTRFAVNSVVTLTNNGITYNFALNSAGLLRAYNVALGVPAGLTPISLGAITSSGAVASAPATTTTQAGNGTVTASPTGTGSAGAVQTITTTVAAIVNVNVNINLAVTIVVIPLGAPTTTNGFVTVVINGVTYYLPYSAVVSQLIRYTSIGGVAVAPGTAVVVVHVVPVVVPATQVVVSAGRTTTITGVVSTTGRVTTTQSAGAKSTTSLTVRPTTAITAASTVRVTSGAVVVSTARATATGAAVPAVTKLPVASAASAKALGTTALMIAAFAMML